MKARCFLSLFLLVVTALLWLQGCSTLSDRVSSDDEYTRLPAQRELRDLKPDQANQVVEGLVARMDQKSDPLSREWAAQSLGLVGPQAKAAVPSLIRALQDEYYYVREKAAEALGKIRSDQKAVPALIAVLHDENGIVRDKAEGALNMIGPPDKGSIEDLVKLLTDQPDPFIRAKAAESLGSMGEDGQPATKTLAAALGDKDPGVRAYSAEALGRIGEGAEEALPQVVQALKDADDQTRKNARLALSRVVLRCNLIPGMVPPELRLMEKRLQDIFNRQVGWASTNKQVKIIAVMWKGMEPEMAQRKVPKVMMDKLDTALQDLGQKAGAKDDDGMVGALQSSCEALLDLYELYQPRMPCDFNRLLVYQEMITLARWDRIGPLLMQDRWTWNRAKPWLIQWGERVRPGNTRSASTGRNGPQRTRISSF